MQFFEKLTDLRRKAGLSQEQLADRLGVTRQSVSKWESGAAMPELGKLIALSELFDVSIDYLVKEGNTSDPLTAGQEGGCSARLEEKLDTLAQDYRRSFGPVFQYTSHRTLFGLPLVSVRFGHDRHPTRYNTAVGVVAIGNFSVGIISVGLISVGALSVGMIAMGLAAVGMVSIGAAAVGLSAMGVWSFGISALGWKSAAGVAAMSGGSTSALTLPDLIGK